jgi:hypothetical protein
MTASLASEKHDNKMARNIFLELWVTTYDYRHHEAQKYILSYDEQLLHHATHLVSFLNTSILNMEELCSFEVFAKTAHRQAVQTPKSRVNIPLWNFKASSCDILHKGVS